MTPGTRAHVSMPRAVATKPHHDKAQVVSNLFFHTFLRELRCSATLAHSGENPPRLFHSFTMFLSLIILRYEAKY